MTLTAAIAVAILAIQPMPSYVARHYARIVVLEAGRAKIDPWLEVAIVRNESRWIPSVVGGTNTMCIGLGQICLTCDPNEAACAKRKAELLIPDVNLRVTAQMLSAARSYCKKRTGHAEERHYLAVYQGIDAKRGTVCGQVKRRGRWVTVPMHPLTKKVLRSRDEMRAASRMNAANRRNGS
jgi:hypothetical protein